jgi:hypothetical protein
MNAPFRQDFSLLNRPEKADFLSFNAAFGKRFLVVVDTEEEFDWAAPFDRKNQAVTAIDGMKKGQHFFTQAHVKPLYVTDYPVAADPHAREMMAQWVRDDTADIGAHLHPWVNPPHEELVCNANSFAGNLPEELERAKLTLLRDCLMEAFGKAPIAYRAGRYGIGPNSARILADLGFKVDTSVRSRFDYSGGHGPKFTAMPLRPYRVGPLIELPLSTAFVGGLSGLGDKVYPLAESNRIILGGLSRLNLLSRVPLTPEGVPLADAIRAVDSLLEHGQQLLMFSFHSPTLAPGNTPYVRDAADLASFYAWWDGMLNHLAKASVLPTHLDEIISSSE